MARLRACFPCLFTAVVALSAPRLCSAADLALIPYPREVAAQEGRLRIGPSVTIAAGASAEDRFAATLLANDLESVDDVHAMVVRSAAGARILLARDTSAAGKQALARAKANLPEAATEQGYVLLVTPTQAAVVAHSAAGVFYGAQTLRQLFHPAGTRHAEAPAVAITDWPALRFRGVHHDISRGPMPTLTSIKRNIELLAEFKLNLYSLYFENTFGYQTLPLVGAAGGSITPAEAREIVEYANRYHVEIVPEQEAFGHMHLALQYEKFQDVAEVPYGHVLSPAAPESLEFIRKMFSELAPVFPSQYLHIGADETYELGEGRTRPMIEQQGEGQVYIGYLRQIDEILKPFHRKVMFWGDIAVHHPELLSQLPHDMVAVAWEYSPMPSYTRLIKPFRDVGLETWVAPGVNDWNRIFPNYAMGLANIKGFISDGKRLGITGVLNTTWMDDGEALFNATWYGLIYGGAESWEKSVSDERFQAAYDWAFYRADQHNFNDEIEKLTQIHQTLEHAIHQDGQDSLTWLDPFTPRGYQVYVRMEPAAHQVRLLAEDVLTDLAVNRSRARRNADLLDYVDFGARRFDFLGQKAIYTSYMSQLHGEAEQAAPSGHTPDHRSVSGILGRISGVNGLAEDLRDATSALRTRYRTLWLGENRPYYLDNILARYDAELARWNDVERRYDEMRSQYRTLKRLPPFMPQPVTVEPQPSAPAAQPPTAPPQPSAPPPSQPSPGQPSAAPPQGGQPPAPQPNVVQTPATAQPSPTSTPAPQPSPAPPRPAVQPPK